MVLALADLLSKELGWNVYVHNVGILVGCVFAISLSAYGLEKALWRTNSFLEGLCLCLSCYRADLYISIDIMVLPVFCRMGDYWDLLRGCFGSYFDLLGFLCHASALPT